jgi:hypothetical protein
MKRYDIVKVDNGKCPPIVGIVLGTHSSSSNPIYRIHTSDGVKLAFPFQLKIIK